ncbi:serine dehydratase [Marinitoga sp. 1135]|uniref:L-serine dehydratase n=1 Tax=Marinitoga piezophila (strain DSM 14283 / JCM 11233 / KA3) TaxID=443254 RepID=H2J848_MARPK|nr:MULTISPECIES: L-serine ammonia-lyase, iron-sulfur-dependent, subunit alpha [Marinitoga]AEX85539.1 L-serine dehydratase, iron-sulfur-dependent, alpha subunit [Marinitoga piezophila KA3]APT76012.1 serine dehydratase [Marinitoga sp. 1137]NUU95755.1 serine dehydratase [Marinitoga sp. 1135]NUU97677.1 serine dehydratase [Marinitoga sp. 1138]
MTFKQILEMWKETNIPFDEIVLTEEMVETGIDPVDLKNNMRKIVQVMITEAEKNYGKKHESLTGLTGENAPKLLNHTPKMLSEFNYVATITAISTAENNAAMGRIVACPTAGACGVVPASLYALKKVYNATEDELLSSFIVAGAIGSIIAKKATISGAAGGCQAEIGTAAAMASAALTYYFSKDAEKCGNAAALALKSLMGLVCDPVGGFVEVPCVKRNGSATNVAIVAAEMALAGIESVIPFDEVVDAMYKVGKMMHEDLRETGNGGIAATPTAQKLVLEIKKNWK